MVVMVDHQAMTTQLYDKPMNKQRVSPQTQQEAMNIAKASQKPGQTKEQTKLIAHGIEHGIALYKKQQKERQRQADRARKKRVNEKINAPSLAPIDNDESTRQHQTSSSRLPWSLLLISWIGFIAFIALT